MRHRAALLTPIQPTKSQSTLPELGKKSASTAHRDGVAARLPAPAVPTSLAVDRALMGHDDQRLRDVERSILTTAKPHHAQTLYLRRTVPGIGESLSVGLLDDIHAITRCPRVQALPLVLPPCHGHAGVGGEAGWAPRARRAVTPLSRGPSRKRPCLLLRAHPAGQKSRTTLENKHGSGTALTLVGQQLGRTVYDMLQRHTAFEMDTLLNGEGSGADEPYAHWTPTGSACVSCSGRHGSLRHGTRRSTEALVAQILWPVMGQPLRLLSSGESRVALPWAAPPPSLRLPGERHPCSHPFAEDGTRVPRGFSVVETPERSLHSLS